MTKDEAKKVFLQLIGQYGLKWTASVPAEAWEKLAEVNLVLTYDEKRELLRS